jgi:hypothetical protein
MGRSGIAAFWPEIHQILQFGNIRNATSSQRINALRVVQGELGKRILGGQWSQGADSVEKQCAAGAE